MLRINVDTKTGALPYGIPEDNPFNQKPGHRAEIYALGLRNPWGISQDAKGNIWLADVGQNLWEEVNLIEKGGNYGWSIKEASVNFPAYAGVLKEAPTKLLEPIHQYSRQDGISITGGLVYRGKQIPALQGAYVYGDWGSGKVWALRYDFEAKKITSNDLILQLPPDDPLAPKPTAFVEDAAQEIIILDWGGKLLKIVPKA
jgi:quinoprotein glucose dehydrogenase